MPPAKQPDPTTEIELSGFLLPGGTRFVTNGSSSLMLGQNFASGLGNGGIVERLTYIGGDAVRITLEGVKERMIVLSTGMVLEEKKQQ